MATAKVIEGSKTEYKASFGTDQFVSQSTITSGFTPTSDGFLTVHAEASSGSSGVYVYVQDVTLNKKYMLQIRDGNGGQGTQTCPVQSGHRYVMATALNVDAASFFAHYIPLHRRIIL